MNPIESRFIPAGAGNTCTAKPQPLTSSVYPRWRGEHTGGKRRIGAKIGLSPLARGTRHDRTLSDRRRRFIPAGAGNTVRRTVSKRHCAVYPRWRGEHIEGEALDDVTVGLSPLARGTRLHARRYSGLYRFIPAGAGNTRAVSNQLRVGPVYPRWRGEHCKCGNSCGARRGLSPLARGTPLTPGDHLANVRFIPAGAGNTLKIYYCLIISF